MGFHHGAGTPHAEVEALRAAGVAARGATAYVSLEPCNHTGRTGPCARALLAAGVSRVVYAQPDPNPVAAGGATTLREAGVEVLGGLLAEESQALNPEWTFSQQHGRPFVSWKVAATLDGRTAAADGTSSWITGPAARQDVHRLRGRSGAIMVGTGTVLADNPRLTVRIPDGQLAERQPLRIVVGDREIPAHANVFSNEAPTIRLPSGDPARLLAAVHERGIHHVWLEGGATLAAAFCKAGLVDRAIVYLAPALLGAGTSLVADLGITTMADIVRLHLIDVARLGDDVRLTVEPQTHVKER